MDLQNIIIERVTEVSSDVADAVRILAKQIGGNYKELTDDDFREIVTAPQNYLFVARIVSTRQIVGMVMVVVFRIPYTKKAYLDDLIVDENFRKKGIATRLMQNAVATAKEKGAAYIDFTARPRRVASNNLYEKLGFKKRDTNVYRLNFDYGKV